MKMNVWIIFSTILLCVLSSLLKTSSVKHMRVAVANWVFYLIWPLLLLTCDRRQRSVKRKLSIVNKSWPDISLSHYDNRFRPIKHDAVAFWRMPYQHTVFLLLLSCQFILAAAAHASIDAIVCIERALFARRWHEKTTIWQNIKPVEGVMQQAKRTAGS